MCASPTAPLQRALWRAFATNSPAIVAAPVSLNHRATFHPFNSFVSPCAFMCQSEKAQNGERRTFRGAHCFSFINANDDTRRAAFSFTRFAIAIRHISNTHLFFRVFFFYKTTCVRSRVRRKPDLHLYTLIIHLAVVNITTIMIN